MANYGDIPGNIPMAGGQSIRRNAADSGFEAYTPASAAKRQETYLGNSDASGNYTVAYATAYPVTPDVQPQLQAGTVTQTVRITASNVSGFTVQVQNRTDVLGLLPSYAAVNAASIGVLVTAR